MKDQRRRLYLCVALVLLLAMVLPMFGCAKEEAKTTTSEEVVKQETEEKAPAGNKETPKVTQSDPNAPSLQSTPNKGGSYRVNSEAEGGKSAYSLAQEILAGKVDISTLHANTIQARRDLAEAYMRAMMSVLWTPEEDIPWGEGSTTTYTYKAGEVYRGMPYTNGSSALQSFLLYAKYQDEKGNAYEVPHMNITSGHLSGGSTTSRLGVDYIDALIVAWNTISGSCYATSSSDTIPVNGFYPVGDYEIPKLTPEQIDALVPKPQTSAGGNIGAATPESLNLFADGLMDKDTPLICQHNGPQKMYAAYAKLQKADGLVRFASNRAAMMVVSVDVKYNPDGTIDGDKSTATVHQQESGNLTAKKRDENGYYIIGNVDKVVTFKELFDLTMVPITVKELISGEENSMDTTSFRDSLHTSKHTSANLYNGTITVPRRAMFANMIITDAEGKEIANSITLARQADITVGTTRRYTFNLAIIDDAAEIEKGLGTAPVTVSKLPKGEYHCKVDVYLITGDVLTVRDFDFTV